MPIVVLFWCFSRLVVHFQVNNLFIEGDILFSILTLPCLRGLRDQFLIYPWDLLYYVLSWLFDIVIIPVCIIPFSSKNLELIYRRTIRRIEYQPEIHICYFHTSTGKQIEPVWCGFGRGGSRGIWKSGLHKEGKNDVSALVVSAPVYKYNC